MKKIIKLIIFILSLIIIVWLVGLKAGPYNKKVEYGVTFSAPYARGLGLDWKQTFMAMLNDLQVKKVRISAYWDEVEPKQGSYNFDDLDFQINEANNHNAKLIVSVGRRLPRWPECHEPGWIHPLSAEQQQNELLSYIETTVRRYQNNPAVTVWQVENEAFLGSFGICPKLNTTYLYQEIALVKKIDPSRAILITDSGELSSWLAAGSRGDIFGTTYYRYVFSDVLKRYWTNFYFPGWFYRFKGGIVRIFNPDRKIMIAELQAEPWTTKGIPDTSIEDQYKTMSRGKFRRITELAARTGYSPQYMWGVEWWYWMKTKKGHPEIWEVAKEIINK